MPLTIDSPMRWRLMGTCGTRTVMRVGAQPDIIVVDDQPANLKRMEDSRPAYRFGFLSEEARASVSAIAERGQSKGPVC
jgi:hypothetical protein